MGNSQENSQHILIVDDEPEISSIMNYIITKNGMRCTELNEALQIEDVVKETPPSVVLLDMTMPELSGLEAIALLRKNHDPINLPIIIVSGRIDQKSIVHDL